MSTRRAKRRARKASGVPEWERLLAHAALLQARIPNAVLVGGTAAALHAGHRFSFDHDHVIRDLEKGYDKATEALEAIVGWRTNRKVRGKLVLGAIDGVEAGLRNLRRSAPTGDDRRRERRRPPHHVADGRRDAANQGVPDPYDLTDVDLREYKGIVPPWDDWTAVKNQCRSLAVAVVSRTRE